MTQEQQLLYVKFLTRCAQDCERWADECSAYGELAKMGKSVRLSRECAELCRSAGDALTQGSKFVYEICRECIEICEACAVECDKSEAVSAQRCAEACRQCVEELQQLEGATV
jgi:hypothetical protein